MRLWSIHPRYLDARGLVALWREGLLARAVLQNQTKGYRHHPQLDRFKAHPNPLAAIDTYLQFVYEEANRRGYHYDASKLGPQQRCSPIFVTIGQLRFEIEHLKSKLKVRDKAQYLKIGEITQPEPHPLFFIVEGDVETWEKNVSTRLRINPAEMSNISTRRFNSYFYNLPCGGSNPGINLGLTSLI